MFLDFESSLSSIDGTFREGLSFPLPNLSLKMKVNPEVNPKRTV